MEDKEFWCKVFLVRVGLSDSVEDAADFAADAVYQLRQERKAIENDTKKNKPIDMDIQDISERTKNCLKAAGVYYVDDIKKLTRKELLNMEWFGKKSLKEVIHFLEGRGETLRIE